MRLGRSRRGCIGHHSEMRSWRLTEDDARLPTYPHAAIEKKDVLKARGYAWTPGEFGRPKCCHRGVSDADKAAEAAWLRANVMGPDRAIWALRMTAKDRYSDRCWGWGERLDIALDAAAEPRSKALERRNQVGGIQGRQNNTPV